LQKLQLPITAETVSAKRRITQIIARWVPCSWASNSAQCPYELRLCQGTTRW